MNTLTQERRERFVVPVLLAAVLHAALFLLVNPSVPTLHITPPAELPALRPIPPELIELLRPPADPRPATASGGGGAARPAAPENPLAPPGPIPITPVVTVNTPSPTDARTIVPDNGGPGTGPGRVEWGAPSAVWESVLGLDRVPQALAQPAPDYPYALRRDGVEGEVLVEFDVDAGGRVVAARVVSSSHRDFEAPALRAVLKWRFEPGRRDGRAVPFRMAVPLGFRVDAT